LPILPCAADTAFAFEQVESQVEKAMNLGYAAVKELSQDTLFHWVAKILYGVVFNEIQVGMRQAVLSGEPMNFSQALVHKFRNLHAMLRSEEHTSELQSRENIVCRLLLEKKK